MRQLQFISESWFVSSAENDRVINLWWALVCSRCVMCGAVSCALLLKPPSPYTTIKKSCSNCCRAGVALLMVRVRQRVSHWRVNPRLDWLMQRWKLAVVVMMRTRYVGRVGLRVTMSVMSVYRQKHGAHAVHYVMHFSYLVTLNYYALPHQLFCVIFTLTGCESGWNMCGGTCPPVQMFADQSDHCTHLRSIQYTVCLHCY